MADDIGQGGDPAVASVIVQVHQRCPACAAGRCETGRWAAELLARVRASRA
ncbi:hypothetical protein ACFUYE_29175 [Micromonospora humida]|uniref:hypothetical protein n=1 Tax=Micromonospora humida TaxID=2809018 RepID=UPI0036733770